MSRVALGFDDQSSGSEEEQVQTPRRFGKGFGKAKPRTNKDLIAESLKNQVKSQKYEANDPDIYQYDEVYDDIQTAREAQKPKKKDDGGSQYIDRLMEAKKKRNLDKLHLQDLKAQKERENEGDEFKDKEVFVTSSYKKFKEQRQQEQNELENGIKGDINEFRQNITNGGNQLRDDGKNQENPEDLNNGNEGPTNGNTEVIYTRSYINSVRNNGQQTNNGNNNNDDGDDGENNPNRNTDIPNTHTAEQQRNPTRPNREHLIPPMLPEDVIQQYRERAEQRIAERERERRAAEASKSKIKFKVKK